MAKQLPDLLPCQRYSAPHEVVDIKPIDTSYDWNKEFAKQGIKFTGKCRLCGWHIMAKDKKEYEVNVDAF